MHRMTWQESAINGPKCTKSLFLSGWRLFLHLSPNLLRNHLDRKTFTEVTADASIQLCVVFLSLRRGGQIYLLLDGTEKLKKSDRARHRRKILDQREGEGEGEGEDGSRKKQINTMQAIASSRTLSSGAAFSPGNSQLKSPKQTMSSRRFPIFSSISRPNSAAIRSISKGDARAAWDKKDAGSFGILPMAKIKQRPFSLLARAQSYDTSDSGKSSGTVLPFVAIASLGAILFGYHLGVVNGALEYLSKDLGFAENTALQGWVVSSTLAGATLGSFTGGALADKFGRKRTFQLDAIPLIAGALLCSTAQSVQPMIIGRLLAGIGIGVTSSLVPLYISEISPTEIRGALGSINQLFICVGITLAIAAGLPLAGNPIWWRTMFNIAAVPAVVMALGMLFAPESPRWLLQQGRTAEAEGAIKTLWGKGKAKEAIQELTVSSSSSTEEDAGWFDLFSKRYWKVVSIGAALFLFQQLAGINAVVYYSTAVFRSAGIASDVAASALVQTSNVLGTMVASSLMDKKGRKSLLMTSFTGMAASMLLLSLALSWSALSQYSGPLSVIGTVLYVVSFSLGAGPVPALLLPEIFPSRIRAKAVSLSLGMHWVSNFFIGLYFLSVCNKFGVSKVYLGFATVCLLAVLYVAKNVVETKGRSLEEIELALSAAA